MKKVIITLGFIIAVLASKANDATYFETMAKSIATVYTSKAPEEIQQAINTLDRVGSAEKTKWEPYYYASFGYLMMAVSEKNGAKKDLLLDQATAEIDKASAILLNDSEIVAIEGFIYMIRVSIDPAARGQKYSGLAIQSFEKALKLNPENPRALALMAQMQFGLARFFNSGTTEACATTTKAVEKYVTYTSPNPLAPVWGKEMAEELVQQCK